jgi:3-hydroxybutyryl-CoA dehydrogenase
MERLSIIGCGTMGHSIALAAAWAGIDTTVCGMNDKDIAKADRGLQKKLNVMVDNELFSMEDAEAIRARIRLVTSIKEAVQDVTYIIEAVPEVIKVKHELYRKLEQLVDNGVIFASNTSGFAPTSLAAGAQHPERFIVTHFWNPGHLIPLVEVVKGEQTNDDTIDRTMKLMKQMNKQPILVQKEIPGFIGNRLQYALFREAQSLLDEGAATKEDIDAAVTYSIGRRFPVTGPLMTADMGGLDVFSDISNYLFDDLSTAKQSGEKLMRLVREGKLGDKSGEGFYVWGEATSEKINAKREQTLINFLKNDQKIR